MSTLDTKGEVSDLLEEEVVELHDLSMNLHSLSRVPTRLNWLNEGDTNTKFFHDDMSSKRWCNAIQLIQVNEEHVEGSKI